MEPSQRAVGAYHDDQVLSLNIESSHGFSQARSKVRLLVQKVQQPWTLSCGMVAVILDDTEEAAVTFLKLFDRRWAYQLRSDNGIQPWTTHIEESYANFVQCGRVANFLEKLNHEEGFKDTQDCWDDAENEAFLTQELGSLYTAETATYDALQEYQGKILPRLMAKVTLDLVPENQVPSDMLGHLQVKGILLQYLPGFTLSALDQHAPRQAWQGVVDEAVRITRMLGDVNVLNSDVRPGNFMVVPTANDEYRVYIIDLGQCRFRQTHESDKEWGRAKWQQDEEGAIGMVMRQRLRRSGFEYKFEPSMRYLEWAPGEDD
ncbi:hypothetical protein V2A60_007373 [Cordyceps javanica]|uniref:Protein kinase domain-containing protein n=1 Tax=Cordyceps javanica TaxID=43265 RepID=A0A545VB41_9HYPO|nr:hypothetical protein IF1G_03010 [Cordyceps javanica]TQW10137.1 hypothetical protein IF2G_02927 [Cordyceps javanica]